MILTFDGPSGSGKSTLARKTAKILDLIHVDSGSIYRAIAYYLLINNMDENDVINEINNIDLDYKKSGVRLNKEKLTYQLRTPEVANLASIIATKKEVRQKVNEIIRSISKENSIVVDGRDIGSAVLPNADYKFYIEASVSTRARRRYNQLKRKKLLNGKVYEDIVKDIEGRDKRDRERIHDPLVVPVGAIVINTSNKKIQYSIDEILSHIK